MRLRLVVHLKKAVHLHASLTVSKGLYNFVHINFLYRICLSSLQKENSLSQNFENIWAKLAECVTNLVKLAGRDRILLAAVKK